MAITLKLVVSTKEGVVRFYLSGKDMILGRDPQCDIVIDDPTISARHALFKFENGGYNFYDLKSTNGSAILRKGSKMVSLVQPHEPIKIENGDRIILGGGDTQVLIDIEEMEQTGFENKTVIAVRPVIDIRTLGHNDLYGLAGRAISAKSLEEIAQAGYDFLSSLYKMATGKGVVIASAEKIINIGDKMPKGIYETGFQRKDIAILGSGKDSLPHTKSIAELGIARAIVAPLIVQDTWHGMLSAWTINDGKAIQEDTLNEFSVATSLLSLAIESVKIRVEGEKAKKRLSEQIRKQNLPEPVGQSNVFLKVKELCSQIALSDCPVLLVGETGTGKEVLARFIHGVSRRAEKRFVTINCSAVPEQLLESELFGHVKGAFTGASQDRIGLFEEADGGTIFLDEIGEMPTTLQAKLLRILQDGEIRRIGSNQTRRVNVRVISATNRDLLEMVKSGKFRMDLFYRLNTVTIQVPPLRERGDDVIILAHHFLGEECLRSGKKIPGFTLEAINTLRRHNFPGNVRELANEIARAVALTVDGSPIESSCFSERLKYTDKERQGSVLRDVVGETERKTVEMALERTGWNLSLAAQDLGVSRQGLYKIMERLGIKKKQ